VGLEPVEPFRVADDVRAAVAEVCKEITGPISGPRLHAFMEKTIGPIRVNPDGTLTPVSLGTAMASEGSQAIATGYVAGGGVRCAAPVGVESEMSCGARHSRRFESSRNEKRVASWRPFIK